jgi:hypothetical protein
LIELNVARHERTRKSIVHRVLTVIAMAVMMFVGAQALAVNSRGQAAMNGHHLIDCI